MCPLAFRKWLELNKAFTEVIGEKINRGAGCGLKIPCVTVYRFYGPRVYIKKIIQELTAAGLVRQFLSCADVNQ